MEGLTLYQLQCFDAVVSEGGFQPAAEKLRRTQPTVFAAVKNLEGQLGLTLLDRSGYRVALTEAGRSFHEHVRVFLLELRGLKNHALQLAMGEESELRVVIGDLSPVREVLRLLRGFFDDHPATRLHLHVEAIAGPWERLFDGEADLIIHHIDKADPRLEYIDLCVVKLIPVVAPGFLRMPISDEITPEQMRGYVQCVIRDTARHIDRPNYYIIEGAQTWTVGDQLMKKEIIVQGAAWGHLHDYLIEKELRDGRLLSIGGRHLQGGRIEITAARRRDLPHGPIADLLWHHIREAAADFRID
ncbi:LysR family transcriptional regulator (plasmid) [Paraburkholderia sprentiae WSM5005]|uniref:LysR family transcriptional regulator n=1 Tax=Paraburkholderia sprentiae WSM5005 TaxID=754502 RepID=A0ACA8AUV1_9BURK|nr:LysR family transcriptional regulator [Paraburkholderia sprentiae]APA89427.2 LysR family transcriptional regulator [Paraburkholderia sprentiae WSM5005]